MGRKPKFSAEVKIKACLEYEDGYESFERIAKKLHADKETVRTWYLKYKQRGETVFNTSNRNRTYPKEFKNMVISEYTNGECSYSELEAKYNISQSVIRGWVNKWYSGIEITDYDPKGDIYTMESRITTYEERLEIVKWVIENNLSYKEAADKYALPYANVYKWTKSYQRNGEEALRYKKRGRKSKSEIDFDNLSEIEKLKIELEKERSLRKRKELELEVLKKKEELERKLQSRK